MVIDDTHSWFLRHIKEMHPWFVHIDFPGYCCGCKGTVIFLFLP